MNDSIENSTVPLYTALKRSNESHASTVISKVSLIFAIVGTLIHKSLGLLSNITPKSILTDDHKVIGINNTPNPIALRFVFDELSYL